MFGRTGLSVVLTLLISFLLPGCATKLVQTPFDSFVCFDSSFNECLNQAQEGQLRTLTDNVLRTSNANPSFIVNGEDGQVVRTVDEKYSCDLGKVPYNQSLAPDRRSSIVFVSPVLISEVSEQHMRLQQVRRSCQRLIDNYNFQREVFETQETLAKMQRGSSFLSALIEKERLGSGPYPVGGNAFGPEPEMGIPDQKTEREALHSTREQAIQANERMRIRMRERSFDTDFRNQFDDANTAIQVHLRSLARTLFVLDRSAPAQAFRAHSGRYPSGSWVKQGTTFRAEVSDE